MSQISPLPVPHTLRECPDCGAFSHLPCLAPGTDARCPRCDGVLRRERKNPMNTALACTIAAAMFYVLAVTAPFLVVRLSGQQHISTLQTGPYALEDQGYPTLALVVLLFTVAIPLLKLLIRLTVLIGLRLPKPPWWLHVPFRWQERLSPWAMVEVFLLGVFVAYTRLIALAQVQIETAAYALVGLMLTMIAADAALDPETVWEEMERRTLLVEPPVPPEGARPTRLIGCHVCHRVNQAQDGDHCSRCGGVVHHRKRASLSRTWALLIGSAFLYIPANILPVMLITRLGQTTSHTILGGAEELLSAGLWPLALLVFFASITVPMVKLVSLSWMLIATRRGSTYRLVERTRLYRLVDFIGRWSMIDVFMISILVSLMQFGQLARIVAGSGAVAFAGVVILTMFAAEGFDPRLMWDGVEPASTIPDASRHHAEKGLRA